MPFQFQCPQGHLLEGDESQAGQQCHCPTCGMLFIIPQPIAPQTSFSAQPAGSFPAQPAGSFTAPAAAGEGQFRFSERFEGIDPSQPQVATPEGDPSAPYAPAIDPAAGAAANPMAAPPEPELLHIPCPNGHELETPVEMLDQEVLCPQCNAQFRLRRKDSIEFKKKKEQEEAIRLEKIGRLWLSWAIVAIVLVVLIFIGLILFSNMSQPTVAPK